LPLYALGDAVPELPADGDCWIAPDAVLIGRVKVGRGASIWFGAVLRGDNELIDIGAGANVQDLCVLHTDPGFPLSIGRGATIGHRAILHGCTIGEHALVGMGATVLNGARIGRQALLGAGALLAEGREVPDGMLAVGAPAKPVRVLDDEALESLRRSGERYEANGRRFGRELRLLP